MWSDVEDARCTAEAVGLKNLHWEDIGLFFFILPRALWSLGKNHLTACNGANPETIFPFPFFVNGDPRQLLSLKGRKNEAQYRKQKKLREVFLSFLSFLLFFFSFWLITAK